MWRSMRWPRGYSWLIAAVMTFGVPPAHAAAALVPLSHLDFSAYQLSGAGNLPFFINGSFVELPVSVTIVPCFKEPQLGQLRALPEPGGDFLVDSFFDLAFDVTFADRDGNTLFVLEDVHDRIHGQRIHGQRHGAPDAGGFFSPGGIYQGGQTLHDIPIAGGLFDVMYAISLTIDPGASRGGADGVTYEVALAASFSGQINPTFGPFALSGTGTISQTPVLLPPALVLFASAALVSVRSRRARC